MKLDKQFHIRTDEETMRKLDAVCQHHNIDASKLFRLWILREHEAITDTVRVPQLGTISNGRVFLDDKGKEYFSERK